MSKVTLVFRDTYTLKEASDGNRSSLNNPGVSIRVGGHSMHTANLL